MDLRHGQGWITKTHEREAEGRQEKKKKKTCINNKKRSRLRVPRMSSEGKRRKIGDSSAEDEHRNTGEIAGPVSDAIEESSSASSEHEYIEKQVQFIGGEHRDIGKQVKLFNGGEHEYIGKKAQPFNGGEHRYIGKEVFDEDEHPKSLNTFYDKFNGGEHEYIGEEVFDEDEHQKSLNTFYETFNGGERVNIGKQVLFNGGEHGYIGIRKSIKIDELRILTLPNGVVIRFEEIIALAGDHYGLPHQPIIDPDHQEDSGRHQRFIDAYNTLARASKDELQDELEKLLATLTKEMETGEEVSAQIWDEITGGVWVRGVPVKLGRMMKLAENNHDHFLPYAKHSYAAGHQQAIEKAREAGNCRGEKGKTLLHEAFSMDAFACHFLTDSFASGHIRTPRVELGKATSLGKNGHLLCKFMHDEDNKFGLRVTNKRGDKWISYGDGMLLKEKSKDNLRIAVEAVQKSVNQVYEAYRSPRKALDPAVVIDLLPFVDQEEPNNTPLFQVKGGKLHRRSDIYDLQSKKTTTNWWGLSTAASLWVYDPKKLCHIECLKPLRSVCYGLTTQKTLPYIQRKPLRSV